MGQKFWVSRCAIVAAIVVMAGRLAADEGAANDKPARSDVISAAAADNSEDAGDRLELALEERLRSPLNHVDVPLNLVTQQLSEDYDIPIVFDVQALEAVAASPDMEVSLMLSNVSVGSALALMLSLKEDLTYVIDNEVVLITTNQEVEKKLVTRVYRVDDLLAQGFTPSTPATDFDPLVDLILSTVQYESWQENGTGHGEAMPLEPGLLVISQTRRVHREIDRLLDRLRAVKQAVEADAKVKDESLAAEPITRGFLFADAALTDTAEKQVLVQDALMRSVDWPPAPDAAVSEDDVFLHVLGRHVIVRHVPRVVRQIEETVRAISASTGGGDLADDQQNGQDGGSKQGGGRGGGGGGFF